MTLQTDLDHELIDLIYGAATDPGDFANLAEQLARTLGYRYGLVTLRRGATPLDISINQSEETMRLYTSYYYALDPWTPTVHFAPPGKVVLSSRIMTRRDVESSEFYQDFARPLGVVDPAGLRLPIVPGLDMQLGLNQSLAGQDPDEADIARIEAASRHLQRSMQLRQRLSEASGARSMHVAVFDLLDFGMAVCDAAGALRYLNAAGEAMIDQGCALVIRAQQLQALVPASKLQLEALLRDVAGGGAGGAMRALDQNGGVAALMLVSPLAGDTGLGSTSPGILVSFRNPAGRPAFLAAHLTQLFLLSQTEAEVALALYEGATLEAMTETRRVKVSTLKTQLESIFRKTGVASQRDLVRLLSQLPQIRMLQR